MALNLTGITRIQKESLQGIEKISKITGTVKADGTVGTDVAVLHLASEISKKSENFVDEMGNKIVVSRNEVKVNENDWETFLEGYDDANGTYEGLLEFDVSKPKFKTGPGGKMVVDEGAAIWLVSKRFKNRGRTLQNDRRNAMADAMKAIFGAGAASTTTSAPTSAPKAEMQTNAVV